MYIIMFILLLVPSIILADEAKYDKLITTNEYGQITKVVKVTKDDTTKTLVFIDRDFKVPLKYRSKWSTMSEDEKLQVLMESNNSLKEAPVVYPKKVEVQVTYDGVTDEEVRVVRLRDEEEGE